MITERDFDRIVATWIAEGGERAPQRYVDAALAQVARTPQRRAFGGLFGELFGPSVDGRAGLRSPLAIAILLALLIIGGVAVGIGSGLIRMPSPVVPDPALPMTTEIDLRPIRIDDWSAKVSIPATWELVGDPTRLAEARRFTGSDPEGDLSVSHESPFVVTICEPDCILVTLPQPIPYSRNLLIVGLKDGVASIAGSDAWVGLPPDVLPELDGGARLETTKTSKDGRFWRHVYIVGLRERNAAAILWRQPVESFDAALLDAVLAELELPPAPVYSDGDLLPTHELGADFTMPIPGFWRTSEQPSADGHPLSGVFRFGDGRVLVSIGTTGGKFGWCDPDCREIDGMSSVEDLERALRASVDLRPPTETTLGGEPARSYQAEAFPTRRYVIAFHLDRPVALMIDTGDWDVGAGVVDQMIGRFAFVDPPTPGPADQVLSTAGGRVELGLPSTWRQLQGDPDRFLRGSGSERMTVRVGTTDGVIATCDEPAGPWELCRTVTVASLQELAAAVQPAPIADHGVGPPVGRSEEGTLDGEPSIVVRIQAYEYPARSGQEVVYIAVFHDGRPFLVRLHTTANEVGDLDEIIAGFRFVD